MRKQNRKSPNTTVRFNISKKKRRKKIFGQMNILQKIQEQGAAVVRIHKSLSNTKFAKPEGKSRIGRPRLPQKYTIFNGYFRRFSVDVD